MDEALHHVRVGPRTMRVLAGIGAFVLLKYNVQRQNSGCFQAAKNMRKQGYPLDIATLVLLGKEARGDNVPS